MGSFFILYIRKKGSLSSRLIVGVLQVHSGCYVSERHHHSGGYQRQHEGPEAYYCQTHHKHHPGHSGGKRLRQHYCGTLTLSLFGNSAVFARSNFQTTACHYLCVIYPAVHRLCPVCGAMFSRHARAGGSGQPGGMFEL